MYDFNIIKKNIKKEKEEREKTKRKKFWLFPFINS